jgi:mannose-6-phosphate isomerase-like protein (cupin superfamily)
MPYPRKELQIEHDQSVSEHGAWFATSMPITREAMLANVFRFGEMPLSDRAFIDAVMPGHNRVLMGALGRGASDENLKPQVTTAENYHIDFINAEPGNGAALHSHDTEETFICLTGQWRVAWGTNGEEHVDLGYLDGICCPPGVMRSFSNISGGKALLLSILGGKEPGHVVWSQSIRDKLKAAYA